MWHSAGAAANQEVPHLHVHIHPRFFGDNLLDIYPRSPELPARAVLDSYRARLIDALDVG
ncbi:MAG TPA: hypothetical protein VE869_02280 [Gemmatimonas sp.]|nr:hypothetical protein [Gemmatimonas sp.]